MTTTPDTARTGGEFVARHLGPDAHGLEHAQHGFDVTDTAIDNRDGRSVKPRFHGSSLVHNNIIPIRTWRAESSVTEGQARPDISLADL